MIKRKYKPVDIEAIEKRNKFFETIWNKRLHVCTVTGKNLGNTPNSMYFHHILPKRNFKEYEFDEENIVILDPVIHANVESNMFRYEKINELRNQLKIKYNL